MIVKHLDHLTQRRIVLASQSPRREQLLSLIGLKARKYPSRFEETLQPRDFPSPAHYAIETAKHKAIDVAASLPDLYDLIIAADTVVEIEGDVLEKPQDNADALRMLMRLSGRQHRVYTGVVLMLPSSIEQPDLETFSAETQVWFDDFDREEALAYIQTGEPMDKAASYGIQGYGSLLVKKIDGCYFNVMGLPLHSLAQHLKKLIEAQRL